MTKTNYINASIYSSEKQTFIDNQFMTVDDATGKIIAVGTGTPDTIEMLVACNGMNFLERPVNFNMLIGNKNLS
ncbi:hypothetical protein WP50_13945 [Lactiplantibacillus plantarum]|nr:hypothetical protein WP50_13945 [Lactiplantibacillus plantarum]